MLIDSHVHIFPDKLFQAIWKWFDTNGWQVRYRISGEEIVRHLKTAGVEKFFLLNYAHKAGVCEALNAWTHEFAGKHPEAIPFGSVHPDDQNVPQILDRCFEEYGFQGLKFHCHVTGIRPDDERMFPIYEKLVEHDRVFVLHAGVGPSLRGYKETTQDISGARFVRPVLTKFPGLKLVIPHLGADEFDEFFALMGEFPNLLMDTTMALSGFFPFEIPWKKIEQFSDRILFGTDFPNIPYEMNTEKNNLMASSLSETARQNILGANALRLLQEVAL